MVFNKSRIMIDTSGAAKVHFFRDTAKRKSGKATAAAARWCNYTPISLKKVVNTDFL